MIVRRLLHFLRDETGAAASEFVLVMPMVLPLIFGSMEAGNFFWSKQKLTQAVRDGARYAARLDYGKICPNGNATTQVEANAELAIKNLTSSGSLSGGRSKLPNLTIGRVDVIPNCGVFSSDGIYAGYGSAGAIITVEAEGVPYRSLLGQLGFIDDSFSIGATAHAPVIGI